MKTNQSSTSLKGTLMCGSRLLNKRYRKPVVVEVGYREPYTHTPFQHLRQIMQA